MDLQILYSVLRPVLEDAHGLISRLNVGDGNAQVFNYGFDPENASQPTGLHLDVSLSRSIAWMAVIDSHFVAAALGTFILAPGLEEWLLVFMIEAYQIQ